MRSWSTQRVTDSRRWNVRSSNLGRRSLDRYMRFSDVAPRSPTRRARCEERDAEPCADRERLHGWSPLARGRSRDREPVMQGWIRVGCDHLPRIWIMRNARSADNPGWIHVLSCSRSVQAIAHPGSQRRHWCPSTVGCTVRAASPNHSSSAVFGVLDVRRGVLHVSTAPCPGSTRCCRARRRASRPSSAACRRRRDLPGWTIAHPGVRRRGAGTESIRGHRPRVAGRMPTCPSSGTSR